MATYRLPEGWTEPEGIEDVAVVDGVSVHRAGVSVRASDGEEILGAAVDARATPIARAWFELFERVSGLEALRQERQTLELRDRDDKVIGTSSRAEVFPESGVSERWRYARSNGVALHEDWRSACERALWECAERDRVLRSWYGGIVPVPLRVNFATTPLASAQSYELCAYSFPEERASAFSSGIEVVGVFGFPMRDGIPFVLGMAGRPSVDAAFDAAVLETLQTLGFLWGEPLPNAPPEAATPSPSLHLDTYQVNGAHRAVRNWLDGGHVRYAPSSLASRDQSPRSESVGFVDLTPPWLPSGWRVAKVVCSEATPLVFGDSPFAAHLPPDLRLHPIP